MLPMLHPMRVHDTLAGLMQFMPLLAISPRFFHPLFSRYHNALLEFDGAAKMLIPHQHLTFIPLLMFAKFGTPLFIASCICFRIFGLTTWLCCCVVARQEKALTDMNCSTPPVPIARPMKADSAYHHAVTRFAA